MYAINRGSKKRDELIVKGVLKFGEPVAPYSLKRFKTTNSGQLIKQIVTVEGRKIPMLDVWKQILSDQEQYMYLLTDEQISSMPTEELQFKLDQSLQPASEGETIDNMQKNLARIQCRRTLVCWHDYTTILGTGYIMITINALYDTGLYMTEEECRQKNGRLVHNLQSIIERRYVFLLAAGSSSVEDQETLVPDHTECWHDLGQSIITSNGIEIIDTLKFFKGDTPAKQMESLKLVATTNAVVAVPLIGWMI